MVLRRHGASRNPMAHLPPPMLGLESQTVLSRLRAGIPEVEREIDKPLRVPIHLAEIKALIDQPNLIPNMRSHEGSLGIIEDNAFLAVEQARRLVDPRDDGLETEGEDLVAEKSGLGVEDLALPSEDIDGGRDLRAERGSRRDDCGACGFAVRNGASLMRTEKRVQLSLRHAEQLVYIQSHRFPPRSNWNELPLFSGVSTPLALSTFAARGDPSVWLSYVPGGKGRCACNSRVCRAYLTGIKPALPSLGALPAASGRLRPDPNTPQVDTPDRRGAKGPIDFPNRVPRGAEYELGGKNGRPRSDQLVWRSRLASEIHRRRHEGRDEVSSAGASDWLQPFNCALRSRRRRHSSTNEDEPHSQDRR